MRCWGVTKQLRRCRRDVTSSWPFCSVHRRQVAYVALTLVGGVFASYLATFLPVWRSNAEMKPTPVPKLANVAFVAGRPTTPVFWLFNEGEGPAERAKYGFVIYDLDQDDTEQPRRILHIPFQLFDDYILPKKALGPWRILELSARAREVPLGHRVFGYVTVQCFNCARLRTYWLHFTNGQSGWYREASQSEASVVNRTLASIIYAREGASEMVERLIPVPNRVPFE
jgi:hypothetical protein